MTEPYARLAEAAIALEKPSLSLLRQKMAPAVLATLTPVFESGQSSIPVDEFHARAAQVFAAVRDRDPQFSIDPDDARQVRDECRQWVEKDWLERHADGEGESYRIAPEAREAIRIVGELGRVRAALSESQISAVLTRARDLALKVTADPESRMAGIRVEIDDLEAKLARRRAELEDLEAGGAVDMPDDYSVLTEFVLLQEEVERLPHDLRRVEDEFRALAQQVRNDFMAETRPHGEIIGEYLQSADDLTTADRYGRGFQSAKGLLTDDIAQDQLRHHLETIVGHQFADGDPIDDKDRSDLRQTIHLVTKSVSAVLDQRDVLVGRLVGFITRHNALREKELHEALRAAKHQLRVWAEDNTARATVPLPVGHYADHAGDLDSPVIATGEVSTVDTTTFRERPLRKRVATGLVPLSEMQSDATPTFSVEELRKLGGPFYEELAAAVEEATREAGYVGAADLFNSLPVATRRPVDIFGLVDLATKQYALRPGAPVEEFHAVRPDGSTASFLIPQITFVRASVDSDADESVWSARPPEESQE